MKGLKRLGLALIWLAAACAACFGVSILLRSGESEILFRTGRTVITVAGAGAPLCFAVQKQRGAEPRA